MANNDAFTAQIVQMVREMPDEAILALVKNQLGAVASAPMAARTGRPRANSRHRAGATPAAPFATKAAPKAKPAKKAKKAKKVAAKPAAKPAAPKSVAPKAAPKAKAKAKAKVARKAAPKAKAKATRGRPVSAGRSDAISVVEKIVKASSGLSASDVAKAARMPQSRVAAALKELKLSRRIFQGGDRRFARYAGDPKTAERASVHARSTAPGPLLKKRR